MMNKLLLVAALSLGLMQCAGADENSHKNLAEELLGLMDVPKSTEQMMESVKQMQTAHLKNMQITPEASEKLAALQNELLDLMAEELSWDKLKDDYVSLYAGTFTEKQLKEIVAFYRGDAGKAFIQKMPEMMQKSMEIVQNRMEQAGPKIQELTNKLTEEMQAAQKPTP